MGIRPLILALLLLVSTLAHAGGVSAVKVDTSTHALIEPTASQFKAANGISGGGTVTDLSVTTANGVSGSVATSTTTPAITLTLGDITPTSGVFSGLATFMTGAISLGDASGTLAGISSSGAYFDSGALFSDGGGHLSGLEFNIDNGGTPTVKFNASGFFGDGSNLTALTAANITGSSATGRSILSVPDPGVVSFVRIQPDNTVITRTPAEVLSDIGAVDPAAPVTLTAAVASTTPATGTLIVNGVGGVGVGGDVWVGGNISTLTGSVSGDTLTGPIIKASTGFYFSTPTDASKPAIFATGTQLDFKIGDGSDYTAVKASEVLLKVLKLTPMDTAPGSPSLGWVYVSTDTHAYLYNGSSWVQLDN